MPTMKDVAKLAQVSLGTVSRVINHASGVKADTVLKVQEAIQKLDYVRNDYARGFKINSSRTIALILPTIWHPFFSEFAYFVEQKLYKLQYKVLLCNSEADADKEYEYIQMVMQNKVDGIIGITYSAIDQYVSSKLPFVSIDRYFTEKVSYVTSDNVQGGRLAAQELLNRGLHHLAFIGSYSEYKNDTTKRHDSFMNYAAEQGFPPVEIYVPGPIHHLEDLVYELFNQHPDIDGIFCVNDTELLEIVNILRKQGVSVPDDVQIIGYDGVSVTNEVSMYVSTIAQPIHLMADTAVDILLRKIKDPDHAQEISVLPVSFRSGYTTINP
ncbi:MAG: LacI family DNA-binding transcriptional regulator [Oenococcus sp.]|uniref:LacI family DNA-binding transcriptional regulator n=1 Tax=Oenococcus sp. TaxID=1979414 RepID=UPI0039EA4610